MFAMFEAVIVPWLAAHVVLYAAIAWALISKYRSTRDPGLLWLGVALVIWPIVSWALSYGDKVMLDRLSSGKPVGISPFSLVQRNVITLGTLMALLSYLKSLVGSALVLVGILNLYKHGRRPESPVAAE